MISSSKATGVSTISGISLASLRRSVERIWVFEKLFPLPSQAIPDRTVIAFWHKSFLLVF